MTIDDDAAKAAGEREAWSAPPYGPNPRLEAEVRAEHANLRLQFALALAHDFSAIAATIGCALRRNRPVDMAYDSPVLHLFGLADAFATEHERRCAEEAEVSR